MDQANNAVLPGTCEGVSVSLEEEEEEEKEDYLPAGVAESSSIHKPDQLGQNQYSDGADRTTTVPHHVLLGFDRTDQRHPPRQHIDGDEDVNDDRRDECPICNERFGSSGDHRVALLHCDHVLCHHCLSRILRGARDPSRVQCPFCRQNTPLSRRDFVQMMLVEEAYDGNGGEACTAPGASSHSYSAPLLPAGVQAADPHATPPQASLGCLFPPESEQQQLDGWGRGGGGGGGACGRWICPPSCCLPSTTVLLVLLLLLPWFFMSLRYL